MTNLFSLYYKLKIQQCYCLPAYLLLVRKWLWVEKVKVLCLKSLFSCNIFTLTIHSFFLLYFVIKQGLFKRKRKHGNMNRICAKFWLAVVAVVGDVMVNGEWEMKINMRAIERRLLCMFSVKKIEKSY